VSFLRTASTRRLLTTLAGLVAVLTAGAAIALATTSSGPVPAPKALPQAVHDAVAAPQVSGISARISFTNHLIPSTDVSGQGSSDPLLGGASGRVWVSPSTHQLRLELQGDNGDAQVVVNNRSFWAYDPQSKTVYEGTLPAERKPAKADDTVPTVAQIAKRIARARKHLDVSAAQPTDVAGEPAYQVQVSPKTHPGLLGNVGLAWDALHGTPLRFTVTAKGSSDPVIELTATDISFGTVPSPVFAISPPAGARVAHVTLPSPHAKAHHKAKHTHRGDVSTRGEGLDGITIVKEPARSATTSASPGNGRPHGGLSLPTVDVNGTTGQELETPLGTLVRFTRGGTTYTVFGSQPAAKVLAAARSL
jgi:outer membrane lipoprotein-sorting protein